ncbi:hypothetical protein [Moumouvirus maliensis]|nr:hypothetical protein [Moumouvirus maliensis]
MEKRDNLINSIETLKINGYVKKKDTKEIIDNLQLIKPKLSHEDKNKIKTITELLSKKTLKKREKREWDHSKKYLVELVNHYYEEYNDLDNEDINNEVDVGENGLSINEIENMLDDKVPKYNKFNKKHPMKGVSYDKSRDRWIYYADNINIKNINFSEIINTAKEKFGEKNVEKISKNFSKKYFLYKNYYFVIYIINDKYYFDIQHIISVLNLQESYVKKKYNEFSDNIRHYIWHKNKYDGYILRELISERTMYKIVLSSNSKFSKSFKEDVADILTELRQNNNLTITNKKITLKENPQTNINIIKQEKNIMNKMIKENFVPYSYNNPDNLSFVRQLVVMGSYIELSKYVKKHVLYGFIIPLHNENNHIIIKFGYTEDIIDRIRTLKKEYKSDVYLVRIVTIKGESEEQVFHNLLKSRYENLIEKYSIEEKDKVELYKFNPILLNIFDAYKINNKDLKESEKITPDEQFIINSVKTQESLFSNLVLNYEYNILSKQPGNKELYDFILEKQKMYHHEKIKKEEQEHIERMKKMKYDNFDKYMEMKKIKLEILKAKNNTSDNNNNNKSPPLKRTSSKEILRL